MYPPEDVNLAGLDLNLLVVLDVLMREKSVARAAVVLHRTASAVSHALSRLRQQLDDPLLVRHGTQMVLTPYAHRLCTQMQPLLHDMRLLLRRPRKFSPATSSIVLRYAQADVAPDLYSTVFRALHAAAPSVGLHWHPVSEATLPALAQGELDLAVLPRPAYHAEGVQAAHLFTLDGRAPCGPIIPPPTAGRPKRLTPGRTCPFRRETSCTFR